ncbi:hypothetical protein PYK22_02757 [Pyrinomonas methylaliphatogenes]|uniref:Uncharacterized protein n=1 Tax=Pyrinomonas methylaliphatogenes TaxID=454194 RepID=A0A0B6X2D6_9BACT|nr:hypothetical protein PYK22_02757 [Pyrinomonas methylaliphatogenes]
MNQTRLKFRQPDPRALDDIVFDVLGLTAGEREVMKRLSSLSAQLEKAKSV